MQPPGMEDTAEASSSREVLPELLLQPVLKTSPLLEKGRVSCCICFTGSTQKNYKRKNFQKITDVDTFKQKALEWTNYEHKYSAIYENVDWSPNTVLHAHKNCKPKPNLR